MTLQEHRRWGSRSPPPIFLPEQTRHPTAKTSFPILEAAAILPMAAAVLHMLHVHRQQSSCTLRRVFVHSSANADAARRARARKLEQAAGELDRLTRGLGSRHYPDAAKVTARVSAIAAARRVADYLRADAAPAQTGGRPWTGASTRPRSTPKPPPTAGTRY